MQTIINNVICKQMHFRKKPGAFAIEGEDYTSGAYVTAYTKNEYPGQAAVQFNYATDAFAIYTINVANAGSYEVLAVGNGTPTEGFIKGDLYLDDAFISSTLLENGNGWNVFANSYQSNLGTVGLLPGEQTIKLVINGGSYVMDKIVFAPCTVTGTLTLEAEKYYIQYNTEEYSKPEEYPGRSAVLVGRNGSKLSSITWGVVTESEGTYEVTVYGNGVAYEEGGDTAITGKLYVDNEVQLTKDLTISGAWNIFDDAKRLLTEFGSVELTAGAHIIKLELETGSYVLDKIILKLPEAAEGGSGSGSSGDETPTIITIEGEDYSHPYGGVNLYTKPYEYPGQAAVQFNYTINASATYTINVETAGIYTFTTIGTGSPAVDGGSVIGDLYVDGDHISQPQTPLSINGYWNVFAEGNALKTELGTAYLTAGEHTIKFVVNDGVYVMDKMLLTPKETDSDSDDEASKYVPYKKVYADGVLVFSAEEYIYAGYGTLAEGVTLSGMTEYDANGGGLYRSVWDNADNDGGYNSNPTTATVKICGVDLTGFSKLSIKSGASNGEPNTQWCNYGAGGHGKVFWGIDSADDASTLLAEGTAGQYNYEKEYSGELDVSGYTGVHDIVFYLSALCHYSGDGVYEKASLYLTEVKLYN